MTTYCSSKRPTSAAGMLGYVLISGTLAMPVAVRLMPNIYGAVTMSFTVALAFSTLIPAIRVMRGRRYGGCRIELDCEHQTLYFEQLPHFGLCMLRGKRVTRSVPFDEVQSIRVSGGSVWARTTVIVAEPARPPERFVLPYSMEMTNWLAFARALQSEFADRVSIRWVDRPVGIVLVLLGTLFVAVVITAVIAILMILIGP